MDNTQNCDSYMFLTLFGCTFMRSPVFFKCLSWLAGIQHHFQIVGDQV
jgi:hypothetical protein